MIIIAEKINGSIPSMAKAISEHDSEWIKEIARKQDAVLSDDDFIDCAVGIEEGELETMEWMINCIQEVSDKKIAVDSPNPQICLDAMKFCKRPGMINSVSGEGNKVDLVFPVIADTEWDVMALLCDDTGIPKTADDRIRVLNNIMAKAKEYGIAESRIHIDPLNRDLRGSIYAAEALTGEDYYCMEYVGAFREGIFGPVDKK